MRNKNEKIVFLRLPNETAFIRLAADFVMQGAIGLGLDQDAAQYLSLAAEEVMTYVVRVGTPNGEVEIHCSTGSHYVQVDISFPFDNVKLRSLNMTATVSLNDENENILDEMELLIASRMADQFRIHRRPSGHPQLSLRKDFRYPEIADDIAAAEPSAITSFTINAPDAAQIKWFLLLVNKGFSATCFPKDFLYPGKIVDMTAAAEYQLLIAVSPSGEIGGGVVWKWDGTKTVELFGPYIFNPQSDSHMALQLMDACISSVARTSALVLINRLSPEKIPDGYMEPLGTIGIGTQVSQSPRHTVYFREMHEDMGTVSWTHPDLYNFLEQEYERLYFPREIRVTAVEGEAGEAHSVLSADFDRRLQQVTLRPIWPGADRVENLKDHLALIQREGLELVLFEMDLGSSWQAEFAPGLLSLGFQPQLILPHAGIGDILIFELRFAQQ